MHAGYRSLSLGWGRKRNCQMSELQSFCMGKNNLTWFIIIKLQFCSHGCKKKSDCEKTKYVGIYAKDIPFVACGQNISQDLLVSSIERLI